MDFTILTIMKKKEKLIDLNITWIYMIRKKSYGFVLDNKQMLYNHNCKERCESPVSIHKLWSGSGYSLFVYKVP